MTIDEFINNYFKELEEIISDTNIENVKNYLFIKEFLDRAVDFFSKIDNNLLSSFLKKQYREITDLFNLYETYRKKSSYPQIIFLEFLEKYDEYINLKNKIENMKINFNTKQIYLLEEQLKKEENKKLKKMYVDFIDERAKLKEDLEKLNQKITHLEKQIEPIFIDKFVTKRDEIFKKFEKVLNYKLCEFEKRFWNRVNTSKTIKDYFDSLGIKSRFSTKNFIKLFLRKVDSYKFKNRDWINKLEQILKELD